MVGPGGGILRDWMPLVYILLGYWLPALLVTSTNEGFERRLLTLDHRWLGVENLRTISERTARPVIELLEFAYLFCYPMVPIGFACLSVAGLHEESDRFWTAVLAAVVGCYGVLPWLPTRPPRAIEGEPVRSSALVRRVNLRVLGLASIQLNTFPMGTSPPRWRPHSPSARAFRWSACRSWFWHSPLQSGASWGGITMLLMRWQARPSRSSDS